MEFYRVEYMIINYEEFIEEENKQMKKHEKDQQMQFSKNKSVPGPGQMKMPNLKMPNLSMPKL